MGGGWCAWGRRVHSGEVSLGLRMNSLGRRELGSSRHLQARLVREQRLCRLNVNQLQGPGRECYSWTGRGRLTS